MVKGNAPGTRDQGPAAIEFFTEIKTVGNLPIFLIDRHFCICYDLYKFYLLWLLEALLACQKKERSVPHAELCHISAASRIQAGHNNSVRWWNDTRIIKIHHPLRNDTVLAIC
ncbi:hypothetical protein [Dictyobacter alpinus]|uniref:hypothetical protein n=1 Tax=Dictyobacter alpinus TaxID=2014873 RepID=UPI000F81A956|nr:hypothetical protein [Dictyobacter alpinus]